MSYTSDKDNAARLVANQFLDFAARDGVPIDPMKMQKLVYLAHGWNLEHYGASLVSRPVEAWRYGPVIPDLYQEFKNFRGGPIDRKAVATGQLAPQTVALIESVWDVYKQYSAVQLSMLTHEAGGAWDTTTRGLSNISWGSPVIPDALIADEFRRRRQAAQ